MYNPTTRPKFLNLFQIALPLAGIISILHRISGLLLIIIIPFFIYALGQSLHSAQGFSHTIQLLQSTSTKLILIPIIWSFSHHICAGLRFLLIDLHFGLDIKRIKQSAYVVLVCSLLLTLSLIWVIW